MFTAKKKNQVLPHAATYMTLPKLDKRIQTGKEHN